MKLVPFQPPRPPQNLHRFADDLLPDAIKDDTTYTDLELCEREYSGQAARRVAFACCTLERVGLSQTEFPEIDGSDLTCKNYDFANALFCIAWK